MNIIKETHLITLNSFDAQKNNSSYNSNVVFNFPSLLKDEKNILYNEILLLKCEIPFSFYAITANNNVLSYYLGTNKSITIPVGNYNANSFITQLTALFTSNGDTFTIAINNSTGILTFSTSTSFSFYASIIMTTLGFLNTTYSSTSNSLTAIYPLNLLGPKRLTIKSNQLLTNNVSSKNNGLDSVLGVVSVNVPSFNLISYQTQENDGHPLRSKVLNQIDIQILDENGNFINFNNIDWTISIILTTFRNIDLSYLTNGEIV